MRFSKLHLVALLALFGSSAPSAFATNANSLRANYWQLNFSSNYANDPSLPVVFVQAHIGEATFDNDSQGRPKWDQVAALVNLTKQNGHFYTTAVLLHDTSPEMDGGYRGAIVQYHYFLSGEESQIDSANPYSGGHWTTEVIYGDPTIAQENNDAYHISNLKRAQGEGNFEALEQQAKAALASDANSTSVSEVQYDFAD